MTIIIPINAMAAINIKILFFLLFFVSLILLLGTDWINTIFEDYFYLALRYIIIQIISIILLILFVKEKTDIYIYTLISMFSNSGGNILNWHYLREKGIKPKITKEVELKKHIIPIFILFCNSIATIIYLNSDVTMLGIYVSYSAVGIYTVSSKIYSMIKSLLNAIIMVTLPRFSYCLAQKDEEGYKKSLKDTLEILFIMVVPVMVI